ncbi:hypothetical protein HYY70_00675 [Candidatus Woesearchaeota archaeon]|nr:hypothetical protein [Candidatus Woesearchaeota archaeon]
MKQNPGITDRVLRFVLAFWRLGPWPLRFGNPIINLVDILVEFIQS